jgi:sporulation protein YlmC with PRC-barrel domain
MLINAKELNGYKLKGRDGEVGYVKEFYFDDKFWTVRYLVVDTGGWLTGRLVLISPYNLLSVNKDAKHIDVDLTKTQIEESPSWNSDMPVSRQFEEDYYGYYGSPVYWGGPYMWGYYPNIVRDREIWRRPSRDEKAWDPHLRSTYRVSGYNIHAKDGEVGHVEDFIIDEDSWAIRYLIIDTKNWWPGKKVLISPRWIERVSWSESKVFINLSREQIKHSPEFTEESMLTRVYESALHRHYNREGYWSDETVARVHSH